MPAKKIPVKTTGILAQEIAIAREQVGNPPPYAETIELMKEWRGEGWNISNLHYGILIGIQIAENRKGNNG